MVLSKRERIILIGAMLTVGLLVGEKVLYNPIETRFAEMNAERAQLFGEVNEAKSLFQRQRKLLPIWRTMMNEEFRNGTKAESQVFRALGDWSAEAGLDVTSTKPNRLAGENGLKEMTFVLAGEGTLQAVAHFLWLVETSPLPIKIKQVTLGSSDNSMSLQLGLSVLHLDADQESTQENKLEADYEAI